MRILILISNEMKKIILLVVAVIIILAAMFWGRGSDEAQDPVQAVETFYQNWISREDSLSARIYRDSEQVAPALASKLDAILDGMEGGGFDPVLCAQDKPASVSFELGEVTATTAEVNVQEVFGGMPKVVKVATVKTDEGWQIADITCPLVSSIDFEKTGNLVKDNPGMEEGVWYLVFDEPGAPGSNVKLDFTESSICAEGQENNTCDPTQFTQGDRVKVLGQSADGMVRVMRLEY